MAFNMTYRNATVAAFSTVYFLLKQCTLSKQGCCGTVSKFTSYSRLVIKIVLKVVWVLVMGVPWQTVSRSYLYSLVLAHKWKTRTFLTLPIRGLIINNHQLSDVSPGVFLRIYRTNQSIWNFNPHRIKLDLLNNSKVKAILSDKDVYKAHKYFITRSEGDNYYHKVGSPPLLSILWLRNDRRCTLHNSLEFIK